MMKRGPADGNVITIEKKKNSFSYMTYSQLLAERRFLRSEIRRIRRALLSIERVDPRGMFIEPYKCWKMLDQMIKACESAINLCQHEMMERLAKGERN
jgi:hypothetical protein